MASTLLTVRILLKQKVMNKLINHSKCIATVLSALVLLISCSHTKQPVQIQAIVKNDFYYTCSMHPQVHEDHPGNCPVCGMKLIKVELAGTNGGQADRIRLTTSQIQLAGI